jgi:hypothetical protein
MWDRSRALEDAWADGWKAATGSDSLRALWFADIAPQPGIGAPYLILMTTSIQDGEPMAISHLCNFGVRTLAGISPNIDVPLRTAAIMSARFPIISSSARLPKIEPPVGFVDGGYYENSGLTATIRLIRAMQGRTNRDAVVGGDACPQATTAATLAKPIEPMASVAVIVIRIENGAADEKQQGAAHMFEWMSPVSALYATGTARGREAAQNLGDLIRASKIECKDNKACLSIDEVCFRLAKPAVPIPLGWLLSPAARKDISDQLGLGRNAQAFKAIGAALGNGKMPESGKDCVN